MEEVAADEDVVGCGAYSGGVGSGFAGDVLAEDRAGSGAERLHGVAGRQVQVQGSADDRGSGLPGGLIEGLEPAGLRELVVVEAGEPGSGGTGGGEVAGVGDAAACALDDVDGDGRGALKLGEELGGAVGRGVVYDDELDGRGWFEALVKERVQCAFEQAGSAAGDEDDADFNGR